MSGISVNVTQIQNEFITEANRLLDDLNLGKWHLDFEGGGGFEMAFSIGLIVFGVFLLLVGTRIFKVSLTLSAFILSSCVVFFIITLLTDKPITGKLAARFQLSLDCCLNTR